jgi:hypothetical protein
VAFRFFEAVANLGAQRRFERIDSGVDPFDDFGRFRIPSQLDFILPSSAPDTAVPDRFRASGIERGCTHRRRRKP